MQILSSLSLSLSDMAPPTTQPPSTSTTKTKRKKFRSRPNATHPDLGGRNNKGVHPIDAEDHEMWLVLSKPPDEGGVNNWSGGQTPTTDSDNYWQPNFSLGEPESESSSAERSAALLDFILSSFLCIFSCRHSLDCYLLF